ncbi:MAG TPA: hypothetical protein VG538_00085 [Vicinamibacterales bacterium]|nr:hypothetical protein [Vicinamibacterales bacterium]
MMTPSSCRYAAAVLVAIAVVTLKAERPAPAASHFAPGDRVWLDAHNCYNHDEIDRALEQPLPISIEEDLNWYQGRSVVSHGGEDVKTAPDLETYFFDKVRPIVEKALKENNRATWPIMILHFDFKTNEPEHHKFVLALLRKYEAWLTTAPRTATPDVPAPFTVGPVLVLTENNEQQQVDFHDNVPVGEKLLLFGSIRDARVPGATMQERAANAATVSAETLIPVEATNYRRWVNFPWAVVEAGGQGRAGDWTPTDNARLVALVERAHAMHLWIRFYTLNGDDGKPAGGYNFGSAAAAVTRWKAAIAAKVDFLATDQYEQLARVRAAELGAR